MISVKLLGLKCTRLCRITFNTIITLIIIGWNKLQNKIVNWTLNNRGMSRQMGSVPSSCQKNDKKQDRDLVYQLQEQIDMNGKLQEEIQELRRKVEDQNVMIEKQFGKDVERTVKGKFNNAGEMIQPTSLASQCQTMFDNEWRSVMRMLFRREKELTGVRFLSKILQDCQSFCQDKVREQLMAFINPCPSEQSYSIEEVIKSAEDLHNLFKLRRTICLHDQNKEAVMKLFSDKCKEMEDYQKVTVDIKEDDEAMNCLHEYVRSCCDLCWKSAISDPPMLLKFDVVNKLISEVIDNFQEYHYNGHAEDDGVSDKIMQVVWPAAVIKDGDTEILINNAKGYVIVYSSTAL